MKSVKPFFVLSIISIVLLIVSACSTSYQVSYDMDKTVDFTKFKTFEFYGWAKESDQVLNSLDKKRIERSFALEFSDRGIKYAAAGEGDLVVTLFILLEEQTDVSYNTNTYGGHYGGYYGARYGYGPGWGWGPSYSQTTATEYTYNVGTLVIDVYDRITKQLVWEGVIHGTVDSNPTDREKNIPKRVAEIMANFPIVPIEKK